MRIGLIVGQIERVGGMERQAILLTDELNKRGVDTTLFIAGRRKRTGSFDLHRIPHKYLYHSRYTSRLARGLLKRRCHKDGITHLMGFGADNTELAVSAGAEARIALNVRGTKFSTDPALVEQYRSVARRCQWVVTNSANTAVLLEACRIATRDAVTVIHNGIEFPDRGSQPDAKTILWVGSLETVKDPMTFLEACRRLIEDDNEVTVIVAGKGSMRPEIESFVRGHGLGERIRLLGEVPKENIPYAKAAVFVNSSLRESSSNSLLEAMSFGVPVVATDNPGNRDVLSGLETQQIVPVSDPESLHDAIRRQLDIDPARRQQIAEETRTFIESRYSVASMVERYLAMFSTDPAGQR